jgi:hypothetical protein
MNVTVVFWRLALVGAMTDGAIAAPIAMVALYDGCHDYEKTASFPACRQSQGLVAAKARYGGALQRSR